MDMLEKAKSKHMVAPGINWLYATLYEAGAFGYSFEKAEQVGYKKEFENAKIVLKEMHRRGITVLPGGDYGFAWTPHGTYARDLEHFVKLLDFTPMESILAATAGVAKLFMREDELGKIRPGYFADCILVDGNPLDDITVLQDHDKLNVIMINGRVHKASYKEFLRTAPTTATMSEKTLTNYVAYQDNHGRPRIGHLDMDKQTITPLSMPSGASVSNLYEVIELGTNLSASGDPVPLQNDAIKLLPPISGRDVLAVGKNYSEHAKEFNKSGYDASDKVDQPSHPVIFTKRSTSIIANNEDIYPHSKFTSTLDYEGEIGVIIGKGGFQIDEKDAMNHVWGYTIINDVTAREKQRDHKQFFIGKSADTFCPMGPIAVPAANLPSKLQVQTFVNGNKRQDGTTDDLIFSVANLIKTISEGTTLQPGDVIATGTPAGVGFGQDPPDFLKPGDTVEITVTGLGTLRNRIASPNESNRTASRLAKLSVLPTYNLEATGGAGLTEVNDKLLNVITSGTGTAPIVYIHGLGGTTEFYTPLISSLDLNARYRNILFDLEGHGLSPTKADSVLSIASYTDDVAGIFAHPEIGVKDAVLVAHSMGCLVAMDFALKHPELVSKLILLGPPPTPLPAAAAEGQVARARAVRVGGMKACVDAVAANGVSAKTKKVNSLAIAAVRASLLAQSPEGYAKGCTALGGSKDLTLDYTQLSMPTLIVTGSEDKVSPPTLVRKMEGGMKDVKVEVLSDVGHWHVFEDVEGVVRAVKAFL
jgi:2-keto-4-pentenoate hydratase/2-oxohepta-3-ene-1,7-dioic acid hydratase in catechol pathway/pimeloyl-ACP methyl ester carboxylesterase